MLDELQASDEAYQQQLVVCAAQALRDEARLLALCRSSSVSTSLAAIKAAPLVVGDPAKLVALALKLPAEMLRRFIQALIHRKRADVAGLLIEPLLERSQNRAAGRLLQLLEADEIAARVADFDPDLVPWASLAKRHPQMVLAALGRSLEAQEPSRHPLLWARFSKSLQQLSMHHPEALLDLAQEHWAPSSLPGPLVEVLGTLARRVPLLVVAALVAEERRPWMLRTRLSRKVNVALSKLDDEALAPLTRALADEPVLLANLMAQMAPGRRKRVFEAAISGRDIATTSWTISLLEVLPHELRHREAARMRTLKEARENPYWARTLAAYLPMDQAQPILLESARASQHEDRATGYQLLARCAGLERRGMAEVLDLFQRLANDQDPVRFAAYHGLAECPIACFDEASLPLLAKLVDFAVEARDTSWATRNALQQIAHKLLVVGAADPQSATFKLGLEILDKLAGQAGVIDFPRLDCGLRRGAEGPLSLYYCHG